MGMKTVGRWLGALDNQILAFAVSIVLLLLGRSLGVGGDVLAVIGGLTAMSGFAAILGVVQGWLDVDAQEPSLDEIADLLSSRQLSFWWAEAGRRGIIDPDDETGGVWSGTGGLFPVTADWPQDWPRDSPPRDPLTGQDAALLVETLRTKRPRLAVLGGGGAGKTSAMAAVFVQALRMRALTEKDRQSIPVPVWVSLAGWDPYRVSLKAWLIATINRDYPGLFKNRRQFGADPLGALWDADRAVGGRFMLFLDGLDELGGGQEASAEAPPRAVERSPQGHALARIDQATRGTAVVLTSRTAQFEQARSSAEYTAPHVIRRTNTPELSINACTLAQAKDYLTKGQPAGRREPWERFVAALATRGDDLKEVWNNPLSLSLIKSGYHGVHKDPNDLLTELPATGFVPAQVVLKPLLDNLLFTNYPDDAERRHAERWLTWVPRDPRGPPISRGGRSPSGCRPHSND
jgi:hypothetical protein